MHLTENNEGQPPCNAKSSIPNPQRVVIQGVRGAFHEIAARRFFGAGIEIVPALSFEELVRLAEDPASAEGAVMAIENSIAGTILPNYNLLENSDLHVVGEVLLPICQNLLALPGTRLGEIQEVHSHPMALQQCVDFFRPHPHIRLVESADTAESAAQIARQGWQHVAAIGSELAAETYGLEVIAPGIETNRQNFTRFLALRRGRPQFGGDKASVRFTLPHEAGSLARTLTMLHEAGADLTKIQSVPLLGRPWEYRFFIDFKVLVPPMLPPVLEALEAAVNDLKILGIYESGQMTRLQESILELETTAPSTI